MQIDLIKAIALCLTLATTVTWSLPAKPVKITPKAVERPKTEETTPPRNEPAKVTAPKEDAPTNTADIFEKKTDQLEKEIWLGKSASSEKIQSYGQLLRGWSHDSASTIFPKFRSTSLNYVISSEQLADYFRRESEWMNPGKRSDKLLGTSGKVDSIGWKIPSGIAISVNDRVEFLIPNYHKFGFIAADAHSYKNYYTTAPKKSLLSLERDLFLNDNSSGELISFQDFLIPKNVSPQVFDTTDNFKQTGVVKPFEHRIIKSPNEQLTPASMVKILGCCVYLRPPGFGLHLGSDILRNTPLQVKNIHLGVMVLDSATQGFAKNFTSNKMRSSSSIGRTDTPQNWLNKELGKARGRSMLLVAHTEANEYVVRNSDGTIFGKIPIKEVSELAIRYDVQLLHLGCNTANSLRKIDAVGVLDSFNSLEVLRRIAKVIETKPDNLADFLVQLADPSMRLLIPASLLKDPSALAKFSEQLAIVEKSAVRNNNWYPGLNLAVIPTAQLTNSEDDSLWDWRVLMTTGRALPDGTHPLLAELRITNPDRLLLERRKNIDKKNSPADIRRKPLPNRLAGTNMEIP